MSNKDKDAYVLLDYVDKYGRIFRFESYIKVDGRVLVKYNGTQLTKEDTYESIQQRFENDGEFVDYLTALKDVQFRGWLFNFPLYEMGFDEIFCKFDESDKHEYIGIFKKLLQSFDPSVEDVIISNELNDTFVIKFDNGKTEAITHGKKLSDLNILSAGTKNVVNIASAIFSIKKHSNGFYYLDEQFSFVNSDLEIACLNIMIDLLGDGEQLFFTSHNEELMSLPLPLHSFSFMRKTKEGQHCKIELLNASSFEKRNNVNVKNLYDNDYFDIAPDTKQLFDIGLH